MHTKPYARMSPDRSAVVIRAALWTTLATVALLVIIMVAHPWVHPWTGVAQ